MALLKSGVAPSFEPANQGNIQEPGEQRRNIDNKRRQARTLAKQQQAAERIASATAELAGGVSEAVSAQEELTRAMEQIGSGAEQAAGASQESLAAMEQINRAIEDPNYAVGISYFLRPNLADEITDIWQTEIEPYLEEYFFDQPERMEAFRWRRGAESGL